VSFDNVCKLLAEKYPTDFVRWLISEEPSNVKVLKTELSIEPIRADSVVFLQTANRILHVEFQTLTQSKPGIPFRILDYSVRLKRQYECPVIQVVIFLQETDNEIATTEAYIDETTTHRYRAIRMWEQNADFFLANEALLPLAPLCQTTSPRELLSQVAREVAKIEDNNTRQNTASYTEILAGLRFEKTLIRQLLSEDIMQESVIYQDILQKGEQKEALRYTLKLIARRFGQINSSIIDRVQALNTEQLELLGEDFLSFSDVSNLVEWLDRHIST
jgi:predicted transposase YdaD